MCKKTVGIITMYRRNYGAFLQAYALQKVLEACGYQAELIRYDYYKDGTIFEIPASYAKQPIRFLKMLAVAILRHGSYKHRCHVFDQSVQNKLSESKEYYRSYAELKNNPPAYDIYLSGSDQVFSPRLSPQAHESRLLCFTDGVKVSYAASAGTVNFPDAYQKLLLSQLATFQNISVRETELQSFLSARLEKNVACHIDPSLLLGPEQWKAFSEPVHIDEKYVLFYRISKQPELNLRAERLSRELGLPVLNLDGNDTFPNMIKRTRVLSPERWVGAFVHAEYVVTNSFHGTAFSINLHKKASIVLPPSNAGRLEDIIGRCNLSRLYDADALTNDEMISMYDAADQYLASERKRAEAYLMKIGE